jgi:hypothetical protein
MSAAMAAPTDAANASIGNDTEVLRILRLPDPIQNMQNPHPHDAGTTKRARSCAHPGLRVADN